MNPSDFDKIMVFRWNVKCMQILQMVERAYVRLKLIFGGEILRKEFDLSKTYLRRLYSC